MSGYCLLCKIAFHLKVYPNLQIEDILSLPWLSKVCIPYLERNEIVYSTKHPYQLQDDSSTAIAIAIAIATASAQACHVKPHPVVIHY